MNDELDFHQHSWHVQHAKEISVSQTHCINILKIHTYAHNYPKPTHIYINMRTPTLTPTPQMHILFSSLHDKYKVPIVISKEQTVNWRVK